MNIVADNFSWSYSRLHGFEICPRRYYECDVAKNWVEERSEQLIEGDDIHKAMALALKTKTELPAVYAIYQPWIDKLNRTPGELLVECRWAITRDFQPTAWMSNKVWLRSVADAVKLNGDVGLVVDWKTGKSQNADEIQLKLTSLTMLIQFPKLQCVRADYVFLPEDKQTKQALYRDEIADAWAEILPRVEKLQRATLENDFPPLPNRFCRKWCPVRSCEHHGK